MSGGAIPRPPRLWGWLEGLGKLLVIVVPGAYLLGRTYEQAYWSGLGLGSGLIDHDAQSVVYRGFEVVWYTLARGLQWLPRLGIPVPLAALAGLLIGGAGVGGLIIFVRLFRRRWVRRTRARLRLFRLGLRTRLRSGAWLKRSEVTRLDRIATQWEKGATGLLLLLVGLVVMVFAPLWGTHVGQDMAARTDQRYRLWSAPEHQQRAFTLVHLTNHPAAQTGLLLDCGSRWCVYFDGIDFIAVDPARIERLQGCLRIEALNAGGLACNNKALAGSNH